jgi:uncharacterized protein (DUF952 family)
MVRRVRMASVATVHHVMTPEDWAAFQAAGSSAVSTRGRTLEEEGFVHCSHAEQVDGIVEAFFGDLPRVVVVTLDTDRMGAPVVVEEASDGAGRFPHVYGPLPLEAVVGVEER